MLALGVDLSACWVKSTAAKQCRVENLEWGIADAADSLHMHCREQFTITARDGTYENLLAAVPAEFVGDQGAADAAGAAAVQRDGCSLQHLLGLPTMAHIPVHAQQVDPCQGMPAAASPACTAAPLGFRCGWYSPLGCWVCKPMQLLHAHCAVKAVPYPRLQTMKPCRPKGLVTRRSRTWPCSPIWEVSRPPAP